VNRINVSFHLAHLAEHDPDRVALHDDRTSDYTTFRELHADSDAIACGLEAIGITRGSLVALMVPPSLDFFRLTFALLKVAAVPVLIDPGMGVRNLGTCLAEAEPTAFIGVAKAHIARRILGWSRRTIRTTVNVGRGRFFCTRSLAELHAANIGRDYNPPDVTADDTSAILFTSGSTGVAKGAVYTHGIFSAQVELLKAEYGIQPGEIDLCTFPLFALFGPALGMTCVIPNMNPSKPATIDPQLTLTAIERHRVTNFFGSPAVIRKLSEVPTKRQLPTLKRVISAGAPATPSVLDAFREYLPTGAQVFTPYGATEALPVANIGSDEILAETAALTATGHGVCIGRPFPGIDVRVIRISDEPIVTWDDLLEVERGVIGEFVVRGPIVTKQYHNRDAATKLAKIVDPATGEILHRMGDVGYVDDRGRLWFCGRKSHRVVTPHGTLYTDMVEPIFNKIRGVRRSALVGVTRNGITYPVICVESTFQFKSPLFARTGLWELTRSGAKVQVRDPKRLFVWKLESAGERFGQPEEPADGDSGVMERVITEVTGEPSPRSTPSFPVLRFEAGRPIRTFLAYPREFPVDVRHNSKIFREKLAAWADQQLPRDWKPEGEV
jgi:olefin beta-lactone synthetase